MFTTIRGTVIKVSVMGGYIQNKDGGSHHKDALSDSPLPFHGELSLCFPEPSKDLFSCTKRGNALPEDQLRLLHACKSTK